MKRKKSKKPILIIDGNNMAHRAFHAHSFLSHKGKSVAMMFGIPYILKGLITKYNPKKIFFVWDGKKNPARLAVCPDYKNTKSRMAQKQQEGASSLEEFIRQKKATQAILRSLGIPQVWNIDMEADDYIYMLVNKFLGKGKTIIVSTDKDFHQLVTGDVVQHSEKYEQLITELNFEQLVGVNQSDFIDHLILVGDKSDNIPGYPGIGEVRSKKFLTEYGTILDFLEGAEVVKGVDRKVLQEVYDRNKIMIDLEYFHERFLRGKMEVTYYKDQPKPKVNIEKFLKLCIKYNLRTFAKSTFITPFKSCQKS